MTKLTRDELIVNNQPLVIKCVKSLGIPAQDFEDAIQEANVMLIHAADTYLEDCKTAFTTYAYSYILAGLYNHISKQRGYKIPESDRRLLISYNKYLRTHPQATVEEAAKALKLDPENIERCLSYPTRVHATEDNDPLETIPSDDDIEAEVEEDCMKTELHQALESVLSNREYLVIAYKFGIMHEPLTFEEIGEKLNISKQRANVIYNKALEKLRNSDKVQALKNYLF